MFKVLCEGCAPTKGSEYSAGIDLYASEDVVIMAGETAIVGLGVCIDLDNFLDGANSKEIYDFVNSYYMELHPRSSLRAKGLVAGVGIIDLDYVPHCKLGKLNNGGQCDGFEPREQNTEL